MASIRFQCPHCSRTVAAGDHLAGVQAKCPGCGSMLTVPEPTQPKAAPSTEDLDAAPPVRFASARITPDEMDMTPMVDVTFLLLIFFMLTAAFALQKSIEVPPTEEQTSQSQSLEDLEEDQDMVIVRIDGDNVYWVSSPASDAEQEAPSEPELLVKLRAARSEAKGPPGAGPSKLLVLASGDARHEFVVKALDAGTAVGMEEVKLATLEDDE